MSLSSKQKQGRKLLTEALISCGLPKKQAEELTPRLRRQLSIRGLCIRRVQSWTGMRLPRMPRSWM